MLCRQLPLPTSTHNGVDGSVFNVSTYFWDKWASIGTFYSNNNNEMIRILKIITTPFLYINTIVTDFFLKFIATGRLGMISG